VSGRRCTESRARFAPLFPFVSVLSCIRSILAASNTTVGRCVNRSPASCVSPAMKGWPSDDTLPRNRNRSHNYGRAGKQAKPSRHARLPGRDHSSNGAAALQSLGLLILAA